MDSNYIKTKIKQKIDNKFEEKVEGVYTASYPYVLFISIVCILFSFYQALPIHYYVYFSWHLLWVIVGIVLYKKVGVNTRTYLILFKFFISGTFMFYMEDYTYFAIWDYTLFFIIMTFSIRSKNAFILGSIVYVIILLKAPLVYLNYFSSSLSMAYEWVLTYVVIFMGFLLFFVINRILRDFVLENVESTEENMIELNRLAYYDRLTSIRNREWFIRKINALMGDDLEGMSIVIFNVRNIRSINLAYGTKGGDDAIKKVADILYTSKLDGEIVARVSGNEFGMLVNTSKRANRVADIHNTLKSDFHVDGIDMDIDYFIACVDYDKKFKDMEEWLQRAIITISYLKTNKIESIGYYKNEIGKSILKKEKMYDELRKEVENSGFFLYYQCKVDALNGKVVGVEALARWESSSFGKVSPYEFIPMIERLALSNEFGNIIIRKAVSEYEQIERKYGRGVSLSINISPSHLMSSNFKDTVLSALREYNVSPNLIILEITEEVSIDDIDMVNKVFDGLRNEGIRISLDDFGTGYSSLNYLVGLSIDEIKIDKTFVDGLTVSKRSEEVLNFLIGLSNMYDLDLVCEGVETDEQCEKLLELGCSIIQGYYFSKPSPINDAR